MKTELIFVGNSFIYNQILHEYVTRNVTQACGKLESITFYGESDNTLFLTLEKKLNSQNQLIIVSSKGSFSVIGKLLCTLTLDNQVLKEGMLIPSKTIVAEEGSYMLRHDKTDVNVIMIDDIQSQVMPKILLKEQDKYATIQIFDDDSENIQILLEPLAQTHDIKLLYIPIIQGWIKIHIESKRYGNISQFINSAKQLFNSKIIAAPNIIPYIIEKLYQHQKKITFAESCTGGLLSYYFTKESGASSVFDGGLVSYSNALKENWLGVAVTTLEKYGAVSLEVVNEMSEGAINVTFSNYSIAISGVAGPTGGTEDKPVGTVCISVRNEIDVVNNSVLLKGDRNFIQEQSVLYALKMLVLLDKKTFF